ncbi:MAG: hypothetical protein RIG26_09385 [Thalassospira sp.]|uniref:hypothetical protein n=1 Tax=Thalassospira sp. TaxID=1912094 RepID=UPI0032EF0A0B
MKLSSFDQKQVNKMEMQIENYNQRRIDSGDLISDLGFLRDSLEECPKEWELEFTEKLTDLESANSFLIERRYDEQAKEQTNVLIEITIRNLGEIIGKLQSC